ncbi:hypothetical protein ES704_01984 [subsurface metagenome]|jgi:hypothetical protein
MDKNKEVIRELVMKKCDQVVAYENRENAIEIELDPDECEEAHLGGDCPLCGAK